MIHMSGDQVMVTDRVTSTCPWRVVVRDDAPRRAPPKAMRSIGLYGGRHDGRHGGRHGDRHGGRHGGRHAQAQQKNERFGIQYSQIAI